MARFSKDGEDKFLLGVAIAKTIFTIALRQVAFEILVLLASFRMGAQVVAEVYLIFPLVRAFEHHMNMVCALIPTIRWWFAKEVTFGQAVLTHIGIAQACNWPDTFLDQSKIIDRDHDIDYGLGGQAWHRGAAHRLDIFYPFTRAS